MPYSEVLKSDKISNNDSDKIYATWADVGNDIRISIEGTASGVETSYIVINRFEIEPIESCQTELFIDLRSIHFARAVGCAVERLNKKYDLQPAPDLAFKPLFSTWYCFHQELYRSRVLEECRKAKELGLELVVIDDGWQTEDKSRGYAFAGDYRP